LRRDQPRELKQGHCWSTKLNRRIIGVIGRAQRLYDVKIHAVGFLSTHDHQLCSFDDVEQQALFLQHIQCNLSKEVGLLHDWSGPMFAGARWAFKVPFPTTRLAPARGAWHLSPRAAL
jgi:hypothetical protein